MIWRGFGKRIFKEKLQEMLENLDKNNFRQYEDKLPSFADVENLNSATFHKNKKINAEMKAKIVELEKCRKDRT